MWHPGPGDTILDVGCAFGSYILPSLAADVAKVYAWNPLKSELDLMRASLEANDWGGRVKIFQMALHAHPGYVNPDTSEFKTEEFPGAFQAKTLDSYLDQIEATGRCWLKMDVEGAEVDVLNGGITLINKLRPTILIEGHEFHRSGITGEVETLLASHGYRTEANEPYHSVRHILLLP